MIMLLIKEIFIIISAFIQLYQFLLNFLLFFYMIIINYMHLLKFIHNLNINFIHKIYLNLDLILWVYHFL